MPDAPKQTPAPPRDVGGLELKSVLGNVTTTIDLSVSRPASQQAQAVKEVEQAEKKLPPPPDVGGLEKKGV